MAKILNFSTSSSFGAGAAILASANAVDDHEAIPVAITNATGATVRTIPKGTALRDATDGGAGGLKVEWTNGVLGTHTGLCILLEDLVIDATGGTGGTVTGTAVVAASAVYRSAVKDATGAAIDSVFVGATRPGGADVGTAILYV